MLCGEQELGALVIDNGSETIKTGFAGNASPYTVFPSIVGRCKTQMVDTLSKDVFIGDDAVFRRRVLSLKFPIQQGIIDSWDDMEQIWGHIFNNILYVNPQEHPILLTESPINHKVNREKTAEIMFETFEVPAMYTAIPPVLALLASGRTTGVVLDLGHGASHTVPIYEGYTIPRALERINFAGEHLTEYIVKLLHDTGYSYTTAADRDIVREIKEKLAYVALDFDADMKKINERLVRGKSFKLPDGRVVKIDDERLLVRCPELLFNPSVEFGEAALGVHEVIRNAITKVDVEIRRECYGNTILCGGSTCFPGMQTRLKKEMSALAPANVKVEVVAPPCRKYTAWIGGSILSSLDVPTGWIHAEEYKEIGHNIVHRNNI